MNNKLVFNNISDDITEVKLHIPCVDDVRYLFLHVEAKLLNCRFVLWGIELPALKSIDKLDNQCIHLYGNGNGFEDDTLGSDILGMEWDLGGNCFSCRDMCYFYGEIFISFNKVSNLTYHCIVRLKMTDDENLEEIMPNDCQHRMEAEFAVEVDEKNPYA